MDTVPEDSAKIDRGEKFTTDNLHAFLLQSGDRPPELLPRTIDLSGYTSRIEEMYATQIQRGEWEDFSVPLEQRLQQRRKFIPVAGERGCTSYYDPETRTIKFTPIVHGEAGKGRRETFDLIQQGKLPLVEIHTHPLEDFFSPQDFIPILMSFGRGRARFMKAALLLLPSSQILALASSDTSKYDQSALGRMLNEWQSAQTAAGDRFLQQVKDSEKANTGRLMRAHERLLKLASTGRFTADQLTKKSKDIADRARNYTNRQDSIDLSKNEQIQNQALLRFAQSNGINLYFSTNKRDFSAFTA